MPRRRSGELLTKTLCDAAEYRGRERVRSTGQPSFDRCVLWDSEVPGFGLRVHPSGRKVFILRYRHFTRRRMMSLGEYGVLTVQQARDRARRALLLVLDGKDPLTEKRRDLMQTVEVLAKAYTEHQRARVKASSLLAVDSAVRRIVATIGSHSVLRLTRADVTKAHALWTKTIGPSGANNVLRQLRGMYGYAQQEGYVPDGFNPVRGVKHNPERERGRYLTGEEMERLGSAIAEQERTGKTSPESIAVIRLLCLTGARKQEIARLRWSEVDLAGGCLRLKDSKTGPKVIPLGAPALELLRNVPKRAGSPYVFTGRAGGGTRCEVAWVQIRERAGLEDLRLHDLRHVYASLGANLGLSLFLVGRILGHSTEYMTERYSHEQIDPTRATADTISNKIDAALKGNK